MQHTTFASKSYGSMEKDLDSSGIVGRILMELSKAYDSIPHDFLIAETLLHVVVGCKIYLNQGRFIWRHDSVLNFLVTSLKAVNISSLYADISSFPSPSIITGGELRPDLLLKTNDNSLYVLELTVGFETNLASNSTRKKNEYAPLLSELKKTI